MQVINLFPGVNSVTSNGTQSVLSMDGGNVPARAARTYQCTLTLTSGSGTATITLFGSNDGVNFSATPFGTITLSGTSPQTDNFASMANWPYIRATVASLTGTGAAVVGSVAV